MPTNLSPAYSVGDLPDDLFYPKASLRSMSQVEGEVPTFGFNGTMREVSPTTTKLSHRSQSRQSRPKTTGYRQIVLRTSHFTTQSSSPKSGCDQLNEVPTGISPPRPALQPGAREQPGTFPGDRSMGRPLSQLDERNRCTIPT